MNLELLLLFSDETTMKSPLNHHSKDTYIYIYINYHYSTVNPLLTILNHYIYMYMYTYSICIYDITIHVSRNPRFWDRCAGRCQTSLAGAPLPPWPSKHIAYAVGHMGSRGQGSREAGSRRADLFLMWKLSMIFINERYIYNVIWHIVNIIYVYT